VRQNLGSAGADGFSGYSGSSERERAENRNFAEAGGELLPAGPPGWLASIARSIRAALADGAVRVTDPEAGWLVLVRPDGRRTVVAPGAVEQLAAAGLLPDLPEALEEAVGDDPDAEDGRLAERAAIQGEPPLPPVGTLAWAALDQRQAEMVAGLLEASRVRPSCFEGEAGRPPPKGSFCSACKGSRWWFPRWPKDDGTGPSAHYRCLSCRPSARLREDQIVEVAT
jgi:hypothetical protein